MLASGRFPDICTSDNFRQVRGMAELTDDDSAPDDEVSSSDAPAAEQEPTAAAEVDALEQAGTVAALPAASHAAPVNPALAQRVHRIRKVPVNVIVRIAERKMPLHQLRSIAPGTLLMFDKPCNSPLDIFVNNQLYCRGEAVKVGETFGVKINESNAQIVREQKVHQV
jgi:flagellar motor switch protein FliN